MVVASPGSVSFSRCAHLPMDLQYAAPGWPAYETAATATARGMWRQNRASAATSSTRSRVQRKEGEKKARLFLAAQRDDAKNLAPFCESPPEAADEKSFGIRLQKKKNVGRGRVKLARAMCRRSTPTRIARHQGRGTRLTPFIRKSLNDSQRRGHPERFAPFPRSTSRLAAGLSISWRTPSLGALSLSSEDPRDAASRWLLLLDQQARQR